MDQVFCDTTAADPGASAAQKEAACAPGEYEVTGGSNSNLEEETFLSANIGAVFQVSKFNSINLDFWLLDVDGQIVSGDYEAITRAEANG